MDLQVKMRRTSPRQPVILNRAELMGLIGKLEDRYRTAALLQYGAGLRLTELVGLRLKGVDLERGVALVVLSSHADAGGRQHRPGLLS